MNTDRLHLSCDEAVEVSAIVKRVMTAYNEQLGERLKVWAENKNKDPYQFASIIGAELGVVNLVAYLKYKDTANFHIFELLTKMYERIAKSHNLGMQETFEHIREALNNQKVVDALDVLLELDLSPDDIKEAARIRDIEQSGDYD